ncbi:peptidase S28 [Choiromyces venosus 120613-1]|uniref:Peptidase S28 n=1 Tax=Choiromyces venosus 120613-1 TaxID=1336337 RepID=A0A3N4JET3_9PEZI|nr:peptidase S28 [Choiromyces venosus 120613-1]
MCRGLWNGVWSSYCAKSSTDFSASPNISVDWPSSCRNTVTHILPLDHFGNHPGTFKNRYWVLEEFYQPGNPVFLFDAGEGNGEPSVQNRLVNNTSFFRQMVQEFNGIGIIWEHRYYGASSHVNISLSTPVEEFRWLNTAQALADVPAFANNFSLHNFPNIDLTPISTPWIFVGGSYPGTRAALVREKYPETIFASFSSSAPVQAQIDMSVYFEQVYRGLNGLGFKNCTKDIVAAIEYIDGQLSREDTSAAIKKQYLGIGAEKNSNEGFADVLTYIYYSWQGSEAEGSPANMRSFCDWISTNPETGEVSGEDGWAKSKGAKFTSDRWATWPDFGTVVNYYTPTRCVGYYGNSTVGPPNCRLDDPFPDPAAVSWTYQYCSEWGYFQSSNRGPNPIVSSYNSLKHQQDICYRQFPKGLSSGLLPQRPDVDKVNREYGGWNLRPSNVFFSGGEYDPWRTVSLLSDEPWAPKGIGLTQDIPEEGISTPRDKVFGYLLKGAAHCFDFRTTWPDGENSRKIFTTALRKWLGSFKKKTN